VFATGLFLRGDCLPVLSLMALPAGRIHDTECGRGFRAGWDISAMPHSLPLPPPGFDALPVEDQIEYVQLLWDRIAATAGQVPLQEWQEALLEERLAEHRRAPDEARPWEEVIERLQERLRTSR
jgi:putative addiction module component (TIGR02574 family)